MVPRDLLPRVRVRLGRVKVSDELIEELLTECMDKAKAFTWRTELPDGMASLIIKWAVVEYNSIGIEGQTSHSDGGISRSIQNMPDDIAGELKLWRRAGVGFNATART